MANKVKYLRAFKKKSTKQLALFSKRKISRMQNQNHDQHQNKGGFKEPNLSQGPLSEARPENLPN